MRREDVIRQLASLDLSPGDRIEVKTKKSTGSFVGYFQGMGLYGPQIGLTMQGPEAAGCRYDDLESMTKLIPWKEVKLS